MENLIPTIVTKFVKSRILLYRENYTENTTEFWASILKTSHPGKQGGYTDIRIKWLNEKYENDEVVTACSAHSENPNTRKQQEWEEKEKSCSGAGQTCLAGHIFFFRHPWNVPSSVSSVLLTGTPCGPLPQLFQLHILLLSSELQGFQSRPG